MGRRAYTKADWKNRYEALLQEMKTASPKRQKSIGMSLCVVRKLLYGKTKRRGVIEKPQDENFVPTAVLEARNRRAKRKMWRGAA